MFKTTISAKKTIFWDCGSIMLIEYMPHWETINSARYCETQKLRKSIQNKRRGMLIKGICLLHDNARLHTATPRRNYSPHLNGVSWTIQRIPWPWIYSIFWVSLFLDNHLLELILFWHGDYFPWNGFLFLVVYSLLCQINSKLSFSKHILGVEPRSYLLRWKLLYRL